MNTTQAYYMDRLPTYAYDLAVALARRDHAIQRAVKAGLSLRAVARAAGVSARTVQRIAEREQ